MGSEKPISKPAFLAVMFDAVFDGQCLLGRYGTDPYLTRIEERDLRSDEDAPNGSRVCWALFA